jgi:hypothetical protein
VCSYNNTITAIPQIELGRKSRKCLANGIDKQGVRAKKCRDLLCRSISLQDIAVRSQYRENEGSLYKIIRLWKDTYIDNLVQHTAVGQYCDL